MCKIPPAVWILLLMLYSISILHHFGIDLDRSLIETILLALNVNPAVNSVKSLFGGKEKENDKPSL
jgi:hypothetical protein